MDLTQRAILKYKMNMLIVKSRAIQATIDGMNAHNQHCMMIGSVQLYPDREFMKAGTGLTEIVSEMKEIIKQMEEGVKNGAV